MILPLAALLGLAVLAWGLYLSAYHPASLLTIALALSIGAQTEPGLNFALLPRVVLALTIGCAMLVSRTATLEGARPTSRSRSAAGLFSSLIVLVGISLVSTDSISVTLSAMAGAAAIFAAGIVLGRSLGISAVLDRLFIAGLGFATASMLVAPFGWAFEAERFRGVLENANMLGAVAAISAATCPQRWFRYAAPASAALIWFSGSRASAVAFVLILLFRLEWKAGTRLGLLVVVPAVAAGLAAAFIVFDAPEPEPESVAIVEEQPENRGETEGSAALLRTRDNRTAQWQQGVDDARAALPLGIGFGTAAFEYASSPIFLVVETGLVAIPVTALALVILFQAGRGPDRRARALFAGFAAHSLFEGWMFAFGSALAVTFWLVAAAAVSSRSRATGSEIGESAATSPTLPPIRVD